MKKVLLVAAVAGLAMASCKKDYDCECVTTSTFSGYTGGTTTAKTGKMKKSDAESKCNEGDASSTGINPMDGSSYTIKQECTLK
jgi:hypothetical protein